MTTQYELAECAFTEHVAGCPVCNGAPSLCPEGRGLARACDYWETSEDKLG